MKIKIAVKIVSFFLIFAALISVVSIPLVTVDKAGDEIISSFYEEEENSLDAVYIGSSNCYAYWNSLLAWKNYGITVHPYASNANSFLSTEYLIKEARKTQPDAVYIVNINTITDDDNYSIKASRNLIDAMPFSLNKLKLIHSICKTNGYTFEESLEFYLPLIRFHSRWNQLEKSDFSDYLGSYKGTYNSTFDTQRNVKSDYVVSDELTELSETMTDALESLLDYCDKEKIQILFVTVPQARGDVEEIKKFNSINEYISSRGYDVLDCSQTAENIGISYETDFYNGQHTNIHGTVKFTRYLSKYLIKKYGFTDKRDDENYSSWTEAYKNYYEKLKLYAFPFELKFAKRNYNLNAPEIELTQTSEGAVLSWSAVEGADGYFVYRKSGNGGSWVRMQKVEDTSLEVELPEGKLKFHYTVVPFSYTDGKYYYGNFSYSGIEVSAKK